MLKIFGKTSSINVRKVLWTCEELGLTYQLQAYGSGTDNRLDTDYFLQLNPNALVPVIDDGGEILWESNTICRYLANKQQREDLLPFSAMPRARVEMWMDWQATELNNAWRYAFMATVRHSSAHQDARLIEQSVQAWNQHMAILDRQLQKTAAYVSGAHFSLADVVLGLSLNRWKRSPITHGSFPALERYFELLCQRSAYRTFIEFP